LLEIDQLLDDVFNMTDEMLRIAAKAEQEAALIDLVSGPVSRLERAAREMTAAWSGSPLGYHANVYTEGLGPPKPGDRFSPEWGLMDSILSHSRGYVEYDPAHVRKHILKQAGNPNLGTMRAKLAEALKNVESIKASAQSALALASEEFADAYLQQREVALTMVKAYTETQTAQGMIQKGNFVSRDSDAIHAGARIAPHQELLALPFALASTKLALETIAKNCREAGEHIKRKQNNKKVIPLPAAAKSRPGSHIFIGHGRSPLWRELKDFIQDRLKLQFDEFNRVAPAGVANTARLEEMLDSAAFAFLVMTAEDELTSGTFQPRMNVVHEAG
jgi:hypothetical protein